MIKHMQQRVLKKEGVFITQQIGCLNNRELSRVFIEGFELPYKDNHLNIQQNQFVKSGFEVLENIECFPEITFFDIGALSFFCKIIVWEFPGFSVEKYYKELLKRHKKCEEDGFIKSKEHRYMLVCKMMGK